MRRCLTCCDKTSRAHTAFTYRNKKPQGSCNLMSLSSRPLVTENNSSTQVAPLESNTICLRPISRHNYREVRAEDETSNLVGEISSAAALSYAGSVDIGRLN
ncbi:hypothetical protein BaRGS_00030622 [Batillaria attramentaria]|uniref:Uncharacterized protein n=1 Tax=Batillaria attramentaria TaxID=370345 RepID=A0ABD0JSU0_9CAEN